MNVCNFTCHITSTARNYTDFCVFLHKVHARCVDNVYQVHVMYQSNRSFNIPPPGSLPGISIFGKFLFKFPPHRAEKLFKCPHLQAELPDYCFNFSVASPFASKAVHVNMVYQTTHIYIL